MFCRKLYLHILTETDRVIPEYKPKSKLRVAIGFGKRGGDDVADEGK